MEYVAVRSLPLAESTREAWRSTGAIFTRRDRSAESIIRLATSTGAAFILNLGRSQFDPDEDHLYIWNRGEDILPLLWPGTTRLKFGDLMPGRPVEYPADVWLKQPGYGGRGKQMLQVHEPLVLPHQWDWQEHVMGQEYRLITVADKIVGAHKRYGVNGNRRYEWVRLADVPSELKGMVKTAAARVNGFNMIAWDTIQTNERPLLFEGNTCPGVNEKTARRIITQIFKAQEELDAN